MQALDEKTKGFTLLEILVVVVIIGVITAIAFPNFSNWKKDREIRSVAEKVANMFANISTQTKRGSYPYVQIYINAKSNTELKFESRGMSQSTMSAILNASGASNPLNCSMNSSLTVSLSGTSVSFWTNKKIKEITSKNVAINFDDEGAICFSKDNTYYETMGRIGTNDRTIILCSRFDYSSVPVVCPTTKAAGLIKPAYMIKWSRFANIEKKTWSGDAWTMQ